MRGIPLTPSYSLSRWRERDGVRVESKARPLASAGPATLIPTFSRQREKENGGT